MAYNPNNPNGQAPAANSAPVVLANEQNTAGTPNATAPIVATEIAGVDGTGKLRPIKVDTDGTANVDLTKISGTTLTLGSKTASASIPVTLNNDYSSLNVALTNSVAPASSIGTTVNIIGGADSTSKARTLLTDTDGTLETNITKIGGTAFLLGKQVANSSLSVVSADSPNQVTGTSVTGTTPVTVIGGSNSGNVQPMSVDPSGYVNERVKNIDSLNTVNILPDLAINYNISTAENNGITYAASTLSNNANLIYPISSGQNATGSGSYFPTVKNVQTNNFNTVTYGNFNYRSVYFSISLANYTGTPITVNFAGIHGGVSQSAPWSLYSSANAYAAPITSVTMVSGTTYNFEGSIDFGFVSAVYTTPATPTGNIIIGGYYRATEYNPKYINTQADLLITSPAVSTINTVLNTSTGLIAGAANAYTDTQSSVPYRSVYMQVTPTGTITGGTVIFQGSNDGTNWQSVLLIDRNAPTTAAVSSYTIATGVPRWFEGATGLRYFRASLSAAVVGGTVIANTVFRMAPYTLTANQVNIVNTPTVALAASSVIRVQDGAGNASTSSYGAAPLSVGNTSVTVTDIASAAITTTQTSAAIANFGMSTSFVVNVTAVSGTPTMDVVVQESLDGGTNWIDIYHFERITLVGSYVSPKISTKGRNIRYIRTIGGGTPSVTNTVIRNVFSDAGLNVKSVNDRTLSPSAVSNGTAVLTEGFKYISAVLLLTVAPSSTGTITLYASLDGVTFVATTTTISLASGISSYILPPTLIGFKYVRFQTTAGATSATLNVLNIQLNN
jgi:hypothetical protein